MNLETVFNDVCDNETAVIFLQGHNIIPRVLKCSKGHYMKLSFNEEPRWMCNKRSCNSRVGIRKNTWIEGSRIPLKTIVRFIRCWADGMTSVKFCVQHLSMNQSTVIDWNSYIREVCTWRMDRSGGVEYNFQDSNVSRRRKVETAWRKQIKGRDPFDAILEDIVSFWRHHNNSPTEESVNSVTHEACKITGVPYGSVQQTLNENRRNCRESVIRSPICANINRKKSKIDDLVKLTKKQLLNLNEAQIRLRSVEQYDDIKLESDTDEDSLSESIIIESLIEGDLSDYLAFDYF